MASRPTHDMRPTPIKRWAAIIAAIFGLLLLLLAVFPPFYAPLVLVGLTFLTPSLWWLYCDHVDRQTAQKAKDASEARDYYKQLLDPEKDAVIIAGMGTATAEPKPINRRWPLVNAITAMLFVIALVITPTPSTTGPEKETTAPPTISVPSFTTEKTTPTTSQKTRETPTPIEEPPEEEPVIEEAGLNTPEPIYEEPLYEEPAYEEPAYEEPDTVGATYYSSCAEARAAGAAPLFAGAPGYRSGLDRDGDGVACEL